MKLLKLKIGANSSFKSLHSGFEINFHRENNMPEGFNPFCFAGLNGSGKSNVLEVLSVIFFQLELYASRNITDVDLKKKIIASHKKPAAYTLEYVMKQSIEDYKKKDYSDSLFKVIVQKQHGRIPTMEVCEFPFHGKFKKIPIELPGEEMQAPSKSFLPDNIIAYSSGENETLSLPFVKSRFLHLDEFKLITKKYREYKEPENSLIYIDKNMSQAVLLTCLLFENKETLAPLHEEVGIVDIRSFRMHINLHDFKFRDKKIPDRPILHLLKDKGIQKLKNCSTSWFEDQEILWLDFYVNEATKKAFKVNFDNNAFEFFQLLRLLYELNAHHIDDTIIRKVYESEEYYSEAKIPEGSAEEQVFFFSEFYITKQTNTGIKDIPLSNFSDGEHQFLHTMGICLLLKDRRALLLLDEPETHFNPSWRAKFIKVLGDSIEASQKEKEDNVHLLKDILLTTHSSFIISDCKPNNVVFFSKDKKTRQVKAEKANELGLNTFGTSQELILDRLFDYRQSIGDLSNSILDKIDFTQIHTEEDIKSAKLKLRELGESIEKDMVLARLNRIKKRL